MIDVPSFGELLAGVLRFSTPIMLAALGGLVTQRAGIWNIGLEGFMLGGAFFAVLVSYFTGSAWLGVLAAIVAGACLSTLMAFFVISLRADQIVTGLALNALVSGLTVYLLIVVFGEQQSLVSSRIHSLPSVRLPGVESLPWVGEAISGQSPLVYLSWLVVPGLAILLGRTSLGLKIRAVGDAPEAARAAGIDLDRVRYVAFLLCGALAGAGGAQLSIGFLSLFSADMTQGRGIIAFAAVIFGGAAPVPVAVAALLFGVAEEIAVLLSGSTIPKQIVLMTPFLFAIAAVIVATATMGRGRWLLRRLRAPLSLRGAAP